MDDLTKDQKVFLREEQTRLIKIIEAFATLEESKEWSTLKELVFSKQLESVERQMKNECLAEDIKVEKIYKLQGEWAWARQYSDTGRFVETLKQQLAEIKKRLQ